MSDWKHPNNSHRVAVIGRTGSGKTRAGAWLLSEAPFHKQPYTIIDTKGEDLFNIDRIREIGFNDVPTKPGLYKLRPLLSEMEELEEWLGKVHKQERHGLFIDECINMPMPFRGGALKNICAQGRSKRIPMIVCTQRPVGVEKSVFTEADFFQLFDLNTLDDIKTVRSYVPPKAGIDTPVPRFHSRWWDVSQARLHLMKPVPSDGDIQDRIYDRLKPPPVKLI